MNTKIAKFNEKGQAEWLNLLANLRSDPNLVLTNSDLLAENSDFVDYFPGTSMTLKGFTKRLDFALYIDDVITNNRLLSSAGDPKFWNWMAARWMATLVNSDSRTNLSSKLGKEFERWALTSGTLRYHRHLVSSPYFAFVDNERNESKAMCLLASPLLEPGEVVERIAGKKSFASGPVCELATRLYVDSSTNSIKNGVTSPPGHPKAFARFFGQLDKNLDYQSMKVDELITLLPEGFDKWK